MKYTGAGIHLKVANIEKSREFYEGTLGFTPIFGYGDEAFRKTLPSSIPSILNDDLPGAPEKYHGVTYEPVAGSPIEIADGHIAVPDAQVFKDKIIGPKISAMIKVDSLVPLICGKGITPSFPIRHYYWGTIEAVLRDPDGFVLVLIAPYSDAERDALQKKVPVETITP